MMTTTNLLTNLNSMEAIHRVLSLIDEEEELTSLFPFEFSDYAGFALAALGLILAAGGGIGGGGILVPLYILVIQFPVKHAIPLASATVLGGAVANNILNARKKHPDHANRSCIDWELILQLEPMTIAGALIGADLNDFLPEILLVFMLLILLAITAWKTLSKAHKLYVKENEARDAMAAEESQLLVDKKEYGTQNRVLDHSNSLSPEAELYEFFTAASKLTALFVIITFLNLLKGGPQEGGGPIGLPTCDETCFFLAEGGMLLVIFLFAVYARWDLLQRIKSGYRISSDIDWNEDNTVHYPVLAIGAGLVAGLFGIGGGIIKGPLMLALGVHPAVASATSACMILFTSSTATISYSIFGLLVIDYAMFCFVLGFVSTLIGQTIMHAIMEKYNRDSYIAFCIGGVVLVSALCMTVESIVALGWI